MKATLDTFMAGIGPTVDLLITGILIAVGILLGWKLLEFLSKKAATHTAAGRGVTAFFRGLWRWMRTTWMVLGCGTFFIGGGWLAQKTAYTAECVWVGSACQYSFMGTPEIPPLKLELSPTEWEEAEIETERLQYEKDYQAQQLARKGKKQ